MGLLDPLFRRARPALLPLDPEEQRVLDQLRARREAADRRKAEGQAGDPAR